MKNTTNTLAPEVLTLIANVKEIREKALDYMLKPGQELSIDLTSIFANILLMADTARIIGEDSTNQ